MFLGGTFLLTLWRMSRDPTRKRTKTVNKNKVGAGAVCVFGVLGGEASACVLRCGHLRRRGLLF